MGRNALVVLAVCLRFAFGARLPLEVCTMYRQAGDVYIGGVFSLHTDGVSDEGKKGGLPQGCKTRLPIRSLQVVESMVYAVKTINDNDSVLPNITLGFVIHDDCSRDEYAMWGSLSILMGARAVTEGDNCRIPGRMSGNNDQITVGLVGTGHTSSSEIVSGTAGLFERPLVSYGSTGQELLIGEAFPYFFSTIAYDDYKNAVILDVLDHFKWQYIGLVYASAYDTLEMLDGLKHAAVARRVCMHINTRVSRVPTEKELNTMISMLQENKVAKVVVLLAPSAVTVEAVLSAVLEADPPMNLTWLVSTAAQGNDHILPSRLAQGNLFIEYHTPKLDGFERYFRSLRAEKTESPWFEEFCGDLDQCMSFSTEGFSKTIPTLAPTMDAVYALAFALDKTVYRLNCSGALSDCLTSHGAEIVFANMLRNVSFAGTRGQFRFNRDFRSVSGHFIIKNMQEINGTSTMVEVGWWSSSAGPGTPWTRKLSMKESLIQWRGVLGNQTPRSACKEECEPGYVEEVLAKKCCWGCRACNSDEIVNGTDCVKCQQAEWPNDGRNECLRLVPITVTWSDPLAMTLVSLVCLGLLLCSLSAIGLIKYRRHPLVKASSRELSCVNIAGLVLGYLAVIPTLQPPTPEICGAAQVLLTLAFTLMYAPLLLKVNRIHRIFESGARSAKPPKYTGPRAQLLIVAVLVAVQVMLMVITAVAVPNTWTSVRQLFPSPPANQPRTLETFCQYDVGFLVTGSYNTLLCLACSFYGFKVRNVPGNYNEAKFFAANVYTTLVLSLSALPVYFVAETATALAVSVSLVPIVDGYVTLFCIYLTKLYAVIFKKVGDGVGNLNQKAEVRGGNLHLKSRIVSVENATKVYPTTAHRETKS